MSDDDNTASELPFEEENSFSGDGDIEQGGKIVAVIASETILDGDGQRSSSAGLGGATSTPTPSTTTTAWPLGGLEYKDEEAAAAPVAVAAAVGNEEEDTITMIVAASEDAETPSQPPAQDDPAMMMEQIEDEDDGPPLPLSQERDSLDDAKKMAAISSSRSRISLSSTAGDPIVQKLEEHRSPGGAR